MANVLKKFGKFVKKEGKQLGKFAAKTAGEVITLPLIPFMIPMKAILSKRGVAVKGLDMPQTIETFYKEVVSKKNNKTSHYDDIPNGTLTRHDLYKQPASYLNDAPDNIGGDILVMAVTAVIDYFKDKSAKKKQANAAGLDVKQVLTSEEVTAANATDQIKKDLADKLKDDKPVKAGDIKKYVPYIIGLIVLVVVVYMFTKKK